MIRKTTKCFIIREVPMPLKTKECNLFFYRLKQNAPGLLFMFCKTPANTHQPGHCIFRQIIPYPSTHSGPGRRCFHGVTLRDNQPIHPLTRPGCRKESPCYGQKGYKGSPQKELPLHTFLCP